MKKLLPILTAIIFIVIIAGIFISMSEEKKMLVVYEGNHKREPIDIKLNHFQDRQCSMTIQSIEHSAQAVTLDGKTWFFDDVGCLALWYKDIKFKKDVKLWVYSTDTKKYIDGKKAWYSQIDATPMKYGFGAYEDRKENMLNFDEMILKMYKGENLRNPNIRKQLLGK